MGKYDDRPYAVGKGKPPRSTQWVKGQSGNPKGPRRQPKQAEEDYQEMLADIANRPVQITTPDGTISTVPIKKAMLLKLIQDALQGTAAQRLRAIAHLQEQRFFDLKQSDMPLNAAQKEQAIHDFVAELARFAEEDMEKTRARQERGINN